MIQNHSQRIQKESQVKDSIMGASMLGLPTEHGYDQTSSKANQLQ